MALKLPRLQRQLPIVDAKGNPTLQFQQWIQTFAESIEAGVDAVAAAQTAADLANAAAVTAQTAAETAATAADTAQTTAAAAQAAVDAIVLPPSETRTVTANANVTLGDATLLVDATSGPIGITLMAAADGDSIVIRKIDATANVVTVYAPFGETVNGAASIALSTQYETVNCLTDGFEWYG